MCRILVVDNDAGSRELMRHVLKPVCREVLLAERGAQALELLQASPADLVILDIDMPEMNGFAVLERIRQDPGLAHLPVVAVTAYGLDSDRERALAAGFDGYFSKPIQAAVVRKYAGELLAARGLHPEKT